MTDAPAQQIAAPQPYSPSDLARHRQQLGSFETAKRDELNEGTLADKYYNDKQWTDTQRKRLGRRKQADTVDNVIKRKIDFIVGAEQKMRRDPKGYPRTPKHEQDADVASAGIRFVCDQNKWPAIASNGMRGGLIRGKGVCWIGITPCRNGNDVKLESVDPARFFYDPRSVRDDFSDARFMGVQIWMDKDELKELHPDKAEDIDKLADRSSSSNSGIGIPADFDQELMWFDMDANRARVVEIYEKRLIAGMMKAAWHYCKFSGTLVLDGMVSPYQDEDGNPDNPYEAWSPYIDEKGDRYGIVRTMKTMQDEINHRRSKVMFMLSSRQTFSNTPGAIPDVDKFKAEANKTDGHLEFTHGEWGKDVGFVDNSQQLKGQAEMLDQAIQRLEAYGPNRSVIKEDGGRAAQSGRAILAQQDSGMTEMSPIFERQRDWKLRVYRKIWSRIRQAWTAERWIALTDDESDVQHLPINQYEQVVDPMTGMPTIKATNVVAQIDVDIILDEGPDTVVMQEELMQTLSQLGNTPPPLWSVFIELSGVNNKDRLIKMVEQAMQPPPEQQALAARMQKLEEMLKGAQIDGAIATTEKTRADTLAALGSAFTPQQPQVHEDKVTGQITQLPAAPEPDFNAAFSALSMFPLTYPKPTPGQQSEMPEQPPQMPPINGGQLHEAPMDGMPPEQMNAMMGQGGLPPPQQMPMGQ